MRRIGLACNITTLYAEARAEESVSASGWQALAVLVRSSVSNVEMILTFGIHLAEEIGSEEEESNGNEDKDARDNEGEEKRGRENSEPIGQDDIIFNEYNMSKRFREFKQHMQAKAKQAGFYLDANLQELLIDLSLTTALDTLKLEIPIDQFNTVFEAANMDPVPMSAYASELSNALDKAPLSTRTLGETLYDVGYRKDFDLVTHDDANFMEIMIWYL
ncbi:hypothetical protein G6F42_018621 [Rhizopus arrhizus]|nr:hypothetical protein G6F42_018621 [Rhizopus arrhizus]